MDVGKIDVRAGRDLRPFHLGQTGRVVVDGRSVVSLSHERLALASRSGVLVGIPESQRQGRRARHQRSCANRCSHPNVTDRCFHVIASCLSPTLRLN